MGRRGLLRASALLPLPWSARTLQAKSRLAAVATFSILRDLTAHIAGDAAHVNVLVGANGDTHSYQPKLSDGSLVAQAALLVSNGLGFEEWLPRILSTVSFAGGHVVASQGIVPLRRSGAAAGIVDPHAWNDVANARRYARNIAIGLKTIDPGNAVAYRERARGLDAKLAALDAWVRAEIARVPVTRRRVITTHDAFGYFARAYGVEFLSVRGVNPTRDPDAREVAALITLARREKIKALFVENLGSTQFMRQIAQETGCMIGGELYPDALSGPEGPAASYEALMRHNVTTLVTGMLKN